MSVATERLIVPISPEDKRLIETRATDLRPRISTAEYVRRAALGYNSGDAAVEAELRLLLPELDRVHAATLAQLDRTDAVLDAALAHFAALATPAAG